MQIGVTREATEFDGQALPVSSACFQRWMEHAESAAAAGDDGYPIGRRLLDLLKSEAEEAEVDLWNHARRAVAEVFDKSVYRMATALPQDILAVALCVRGVLDLALPQNDVVMLELAGMLLVCPPGMLRSGHAALPSGHAALRACCFVTPLRAASLSCREHRGGRASPGGLHTAGRR